MYKIQSPSIQQFDSLTIQSQILANVTIQQFNDSTVLLPYN